jgi:hypothetical protein
LVKHKAYLAKLETQLIEIHISDAGVMFSQ